MLRSAHVAILVSLSLLLAGCGSSNSSSTSNSPTPTATGTTPPPNGGGSGGSTGGGGSQGPIAYTYVGTILNSSAGIYGFAITSSGAATSVPGSPVSGPSSYVVTNSGFVFGTDSHNIASYARGGDGSLQQTSSTLAVLSNGPGELWAIGALSLDHTGQTLYAMENAGADDLYYFFFSIGADGKITNFGKIGPKVDYVSPLVFSPDNSYAYGFGCFHANWDLTGFHRNSDGSLTQIGGTNPAIPAYAGNAHTYCPSGEAVSQSGYMAVAVSSPEVSSMGIGTYKINSDGSLTFVQNSTMTLQLQLASTCCGITGMSFDPTGQFLAIAGSGGIQMFQLNPGGTLSPLGGIQQPGPKYASVAWDKDNHLYAISDSGLYVFGVSQGVLTPASGSPHPAGAAGSLTVLPTH